MPAKRRTVIRPSHLWRATPHHLTITFTRGGVPVQVSLLLVGYGYDVRAEEQHFDHPAPPFSRVFLFTDGGATVYVKGDRHTLQKGKVFLLPSGQPFKVDYTRSSLNFYHLFVHSLTDTSIFGGTKGIPSLDDGDLFDRVLAAYRSEDTYRVMVALAEVVGRFAEPLLDDLAEQSSRMSDYDELLRLIQQTPPALIRVEDLAEQLHRSRSALSKGFRKKMGISLKQYINQVQVQRAQEMLQLTDNKVAAVAQELGYDEPNYFYRFFRKMTGYTPVEYRQRLARSAGAS